VLAVAGYEQVSILTRLHQHRALPGCAHRAAQARATRARRILAVEHRRVWGILTGLDFARAATALR
jgi:hypothetical protein